MKAVEISEVGHARIVELNDPEPGENEVLIKIRATGICGADVAAFAGQHPFRIPPVVTGHEAVGTVVSFGHEVTHLRIGDRVVVEPQTGCGNCSLCRQGTYNVCQNKRVMGTRDWTGSFAEYIVAPSQCVYKVPSGYSMDQAVLIEPFSVAIHSFRQAKLKKSETIAILGSGTIGLMHVLASRLYDPRIVICSDLKEHNLHVALSLGATHAVNARDKNVTAKINKLTGGQGVDACFVIHHTDDVMKLAIESIRPKGKIILVANFITELMINLRRVQQRECEAVGTMMYTREDYLTAIDLAGNTNYPLSRLITHRIGLEEVPIFLQHLNNQEIENVIKAVIEI